MLIFNCTKIAKDFFSKKSVVKGKKSDDAICEKAPHNTIDLSEEHFDEQFAQRTVRPWQWVVHVIKVKRKNVIIAMDHNARFTITLTGIKKGDYKSFLAQFEIHLKVQLWELLATVLNNKKQVTDSIDDYFSNFRQCIFYARGDRSVQAHINDVAWHFQNYYDSPNEIPVGEELLSFDNFANELLRKTKTHPDYFIPEVNFLHRALIEVAQISQANASKVIDQFKLQRREEFKAKMLLAESETLSPASNAKSNNNVISLEKYRK
jgi:hypothetical protein